MQIPNKINIGDKIGVISTARKISLEELQPAIETFNSWGLKVMLGKFIFESENQFSGSVTQRAFDLQNMIDDTSIKAIFCARGGYGTIQIIDKVDFSNLIKHPKWIIGYSDITVLHSHLNCLGISSLHAPMPIDFLKNTQSSFDSLSQALFKKEHVVETISHKFNRLGKARGEVVGGNLSILYSLLASNSDINTDSKILFIEDLDEYLYHIERMIISMERSGKFKQLQGMIIGGMTEMNDNSIPFGKTANKIIFEHVKKYQFPVCFGFPSGHVSENQSIKFGVRSILDINENGVSLLQQE